MRKPPPAAIPQSRLGRLPRLGYAAGELAVGAAAEGLRRFARGEAADFGGALLTGPNARRLAARLGRLRGAAMKIGQLVSLQGDDVLPPEFAQALAVLRSQATPMPQAQLRGVLGREYGKGWEHDPVMGQTVVDTYILRIQVDTLPENKNPRSMAGIGRTNTK